MTSFVYTDFVFRFCIYFDAFLFFGNTHHWHEDCWAKLLVFSKENGLVSLVLRAFFTFQWDELGGLFNGFFYLDSFVKFLVFYPKFLFCPWSVIFFGVKEVSECKRFFSCVCDIEHCVFCILADETIFVLGTFCSFFCFDPCCFFLVTVWPFWMTTSFTVNTFTTSTRVSIDFKSPIYLGHHCCMVFMASGYCNFRFCGMSYWY